MKNNAETTWQADIDIPSFPKLTGDTEADVVVIGAGIAGLLSAYALAEAGKNVVVLEKQRVLSQTTPRTTAFITQSIDVDTPDLIDMYGKEDAQLVWQSHGEAIEFIERIIKKEKIDCEFMRCPNFQYANDRKERREIEEEYAALKQIGIRATLSDSTTLGFGNRGVLAIPKQAKYHPLKFLAGILPALERMGVRIYEKSEVKDIDGDLPLKARVGSHTVSADWALTSTYHPFNNPKEVFLKKGMYITHVVELEVPKGKYPEGIYEDQDNPYHYFRVDSGKGMRGKDRVVLGGEDHRKEIPMHKKSFEALLGYAEDLFGKKYPVVRMWSGPIEEPVDGLAFIGEYDSHRIVATAFSGNGMTYGVITAMMARDLVIGKENPYTELYRPGRTPTMKQLWKMGRDYTEEFFRGAVANALK
ncbi:MAG TPA: FAD-binding oxidoreductase [Candidatus Paceibacterota bacterium]|jgi:glycine/D-amino acid oxidase-like deaminating enzyme